jgi:hypothetical protein
MNISKVAMTRIAAAIAAALTCAQAGAAAWEWNPTVEAGYLYDDNYRLSTPGGEFQVQGPLLDAQVELRTLTQKGEFSFTPRLRATYFPDESDLDSVDYFATLDWLHRGQRFESRVIAELSQEDIVNTEQPDAGDGGDLGEPDFGDGGLVIVDNRRMRASVRPSVSFELSPRRELLFDVGYLDVNYEETIPGAQVDYTTADLTAGLRAQINERSTLTTRLRSSRYEFDRTETSGLSETSDAYGADIQWDTRTAAETRTYVRVGAQNVDISAGETELAWLAGAGVSMVVGRNEFFADLSRNVGPSSAGVIVTRDQLRLRLTRAMTPRLSFLAGLRGTNDEDVDTVTTYRPRSYATGDVGLEWRLQEEFSLRVAFDYTWQEFENAVEDATSNGAMISFTYQPLQRRRARND